jgi:hypothetical protein
MPQVPKRMWPKNMRNPFFLFLKSPDPKWLDALGPEKIGTIISLKKTLPLKITTKHL